MDENLYRKCAPAISPGLLIVMLAVAGSQIGMPRLAGAADKGPPPTAPAFVRKNALERATFAEPGSSNSKEPKFAPAANQSQAITGESQNNAAATESAPLVGNVTTIDLNAGNSATFGGMLNGKVATMTETPPLSGKDHHARSVPASAYSGWLQKAHPEFVLNVSQTPSSAVLVIKGQWDDSGRTLGKLGIPHEKISTGDVDDYNFQSTKVVIIDCPGDMNRKACQKLRDFVARGGYVLSTDWTLKFFVNTTFNDYLKWNKEINRREVYDATVVGADPVLFGHTVTNAHWKLDRDSELLHISNPEAVRVLVTSSELKEEDPDHLGALAVIFPFGRGYVLHMVGHFDNNGGLFLKDKLPDPAPVIDISLRQALATNFIVAGLKGTRIPFNLNHRMR
jgi:hypothetical protein